jgi:DNA-binding MarR family transcriptional regulator
MMTGPVAAVRRFRRFYTRQLGLLDEGLLNSAFSLTEARVLYELAAHPTLTATELSRDLGIDPGYLSRVLKEFERQGLITRAPAPGDGRLALLQLTNSGRAAFAPLEKASRRQILAMIRHLMPAEAARLVEAMQTIEHLMGEPASSRDPIILRQHQVGDIDPGKDFGGEDFVRSVPAILLCIQHSLPMSDPPSKPLIQTGSEAGSPNRTER